MLSFTECHVLVIGDIMLDEYMSTQVGRISPEASVPVAHIQKQWSVPGGAANVARNLACLGSKVTLAGMRGHDAAGDRLQSLLHKLGITTLLELTDDRPTACKTRVVAQGQQLLRLDNEVLDDFPQTYLEQLWLSVKDRLIQANVVLLSDYDKGIFRRLPDGDSLAARIIVACKKHGIPVLVDPKGEDWGRYSQADCITPNVRELGEAAHVKDSALECLQRGAQALMDQHAIPRILLTRSEKGMTLLTNDGSSHNIPTQAREVADVSGAGDTGIAVLAACIAKGMDWSSAAGMANMAAGVVVGKAGTSPIQLAELRAAVTAAIDTPHKDLSRLNAKIYTLDRLTSQVESWRSKKKKIVFTNGCFDLLHMGHVQLIEEAAAQGDKLIVALNSDFSVMRLKGSGRPIQKQKARAVVMSALAGVDAVILFDEETPLRLIEALSPDVLVKGGDYDVQSVVGAKHVMSYNGRVHLATFVQGYSTSKIISDLSL